MKFALVVALLYLVAVLLDVAAMATALATMYAADPEVIELVRANGAAALLMLLLASLAGVGSERMWRYCAGNTLAGHLRQLCSWSRYRGLYTLRWRALPTGWVDEMVTSVGVLAVAIPLAQATLGLARFATLPSVPDGFLGSAPGWHAVCVLGLLAVYYPCVYQGLRRYARIRQGTSPRHQQ